MGVRVKENQWGTSKGNRVFKIHRDYLEQPQRDSRCTFNEKTGIGELYLNFWTEYPVNSKKTEIKLSRLLKKAFKASRFICVVQSGNKIRNSDVFFTNIDFHFNTRELPEDILTIVAEIEKNLEPRIFLRTDKNTGEVEEVSFFDLPQNSKYLIIKDCEKPAVSEKTKKKYSYDGAYWSYA